MIITLTPDDLIKRCLWLDYKKYCLKDYTEDQIVEFIQKNEMISISENDAYVIGLLKHVETENLIHRFNIHIDELLKLRSIIFEKRVLLIKGTLLRETIEFKERFPDCYEPCNLYKNAIEELNNYINDRYKDFSELAEIPATIKEKNFTCIQSNEVQKIIEKFESKKKLF